MKRIIEAEWKKYNINPKNSAVEDCVKRAISLATGKDYSEVSSALNKINKRVGAPSYQYGQVWIKYLRELGITLTNVEKDEMTVDEFCRIHPEGTYLLEVGKKTRSTGGHSDHLCCVIDGDLYDSWDCSNNIIFEMAEVHDTSPIQELDMEDDVYSEVINYLDKYIEQYAAKHSWADKIVLEAYPPSNSYSGQFKLRLRLNIPLWDQIGDYVDRLWQNYSKVFKFTLNIKFSAEENIKMLQNKLKTKVYDYLYEFDSMYKKGLQYIERKASGKINENYAGSKSDLMKIPEDLQPYVLDIYKWRYPGDRDENIEIKFITPEDSQIHYVSEYSWKEAIWEMRMQVEGY